MPMSDTTPAVTNALAEHAVKTDLSNLSRPVVDLATRTLIDTMGVGIAARHEEVVRTLAATMGATANGAQGPCTVLPSGDRAGAATAALLNGAACHALDYDDVTDHIYGHPSVVLWPTVLAVAEQVAADGQEMLGAYLLGFDVEMALAEGLAIREHYSAGWHATATLGVVAGAAAASRLLGNDLQQTRRALGIAASMAGGSRQNFGTMTKPLHAGLAARDGVLAASLAAEGLTADPDQLEGPLGWFAMFGDRTSLGKVIKTLDDPFAIQQYGVNVKKYPACYNTQRTAEAALQLSRRDGIEPNHVRAATLTLEPGGFDPLIHHQPTTGLHGKFSGEYVVAAALLDGRLGLHSFTDDAVTRTEAQRLVSMIEPRESAEPPFGDPAWEHSYAALEVRTDQGLATARVDVPHGDWRAPLGDQELEDKFRDCLSYARPEHNPSSLLAELRGIGSRERVRDLTVPTSS